MTKHQRSTKRDLSYWEYVDALHSVQNSNFLVKHSASSSDQGIPRRTMPMLDQFHLCIHDSIENIVDIKADGNCGYRAIDALLDMGEDSWSLVRNHLLKEMYINVFYGIDKFEELKWSLLVDGLSMVTMDKWMNITDMGYVIASRYNVILVSLSLQQSMTFFPLRSQSPTNCYVHRVICIGHINAALISAFIERWRPETHTFHLRCGEATITLQDVSVLLGLRTDGTPLIGSTNLDWADLCEELLGVRPQEGELEGSVIKLSWLAHHFSHINIDEGNVEQLQRFTHAWILRFIGGVLFVNKSSSRVSLRYLQFLRDFEQCSTYAWGPAVLAYLYREMCSATDYKVKSIGGMCILIQMWAWERCTTLAPKRTPPVIENKPLGHKWLRRGNQHIGNDDLRVFHHKLDLMKRHEFVWEPYTATVMGALPPICVVGSVVWFATVPLICFHVVEWHQPDRVLRQFGLQQPIPECPSQPQNLHGITLKGKQDENWFHLLAPIIGQWNNRAEFRVDVYPRQEGLLGYNSDYMV
ncbi:Serine/threonine-protein phosphatase 7 long form [Glycine max]|nr:Serine/threonine-protein phosphatase 7 long form [Glycine max]